MVTQKQRKNLLLPFRQRHPEYVELKSVLFEVPFSHFVKGFCITGQRFAFPTSFACPLYGVWLDNLAVINGKSFGPNGGGSMNIDEKTAETLLELMENVHRRMSSVKTIEELVEFANDRAWSDLHSRSGVWFDYAALGRFDEALASMQNALRSAENSARSGQKEHERVVQIRVRGVELARRLRDAPASVYDLLHEWEAENVRSIGLEKYWQPALFPGETTR
jgi:hypothetical protein